MGREIRRVPLGYEHPIGWVVNPWGSDYEGYLPLLDQTLEEALAVFEACENGDCEPESDPRNFPEIYRAPWPDDAVFGYCYYECTTEGTPISSVFATKDELIRWMIEEEGWPEDTTIPEDIEPGKPLYL